MLMFYSVDFDIVIATMNRQDALLLSLPLMLTQERLPRRLIVVDASDDHQRTKRVVEEAVQAAGAVVEVIALRSAPGLCHQRNSGLSRVHSPVVFFPDDDAIWFTGYSDAIMKVYESDRDSQIGGVGGMESPEPPEGVLPGTVAPTDGLSIRIPGVLERGLNLFEKHFFPDPFFLEARLLYRGRKMPDWLAGAGAVVAPTITGFRMSFRTEVIRRTGFDEALAGYALFEDHDACMGVLATHSIVTAVKARVFHHRPVAKRADDFEMGVMHVLNRAYIVTKHARKGFQANAALQRHSWYKLFRYLPRIYDPSMRSRFFGAWHATRQIAQMCETPSDRLTTAYLSLRRDCLARR